MSFSMSKTYRRSETTAADVEADAKAASVPETLIAYAQAGVAEYAEGVEIDVSIYGHARGSYAGDQNQHSGSVTVKEHPKA